MSSRRWLWIAALTLMAVLALGIAGACGGDDGAGEDDTPGTEARSTRAATATDAPGDSSGDTGDDAGGGEDGNEDGNEDGDDQGEEDGDGGDDDALPSPGRIVVTSSPVTGQQGKLLLIFGPANASEACAMIESDSWSLAELPLAERDPDSNPCGDRGADAVFEPGDYILTASVVVPGEQAAGATTAVPVELVDGDTVVQIDGSKLSGAVQAGDPGKILVTSSAITGQQGRLLIVVAQGNAGSVCAMIDSDPWTLTEAVAMTELPGGDSGPCGEHTPVVTFPAGDNVVTASIYVPGETQARATAQVLVTVDGDVTAAVDGSALSAP